MFTETQVISNNKSNVKTIVRELHADLETPISLYLKLRDSNPSFLLESVEGGERIARYSFIGIQPRAQYIIRGNQIQVIKDGAVATVAINPGEDPTYFLQNEMQQIQLPAHPGRF